MAGTVRKLVGGLIGAIAVAVGLHFVLGPFYTKGAGVDDGAVWGVLNWFMAFGALATLLVFFVSKRQLDASGEEGITRRYLEANVGLLAASLLAIWFFWNWFDGLTDAWFTDPTSTDGQGETRLLFWGFIDPMYVLVTCAGARLFWRRGSQQA